jgi:hypothetical protein
MPRWRRGLHDEARGWPGGGAAEGGRRGAAGDQAAPLCWLLCGGLGCAAAAGFCCVGSRPRRFAGVAVRGIRRRRCLLGLLCGDQAAPLCWVAVRGVRLRRCCRGCWVGIRRRRCLLVCGAGDQAAPLFAGFAVRGTGLCRCCWVLLCGGLGCAAVAGFCCAGV